MRRILLLPAAVAAAALALPRTAIAIVYMPPETVHAPASLSPGCRPVVQQLGGTSGGRDVPYPGLRLAARVTRGATSFITGGSGTAKMSRAAQLRAAGLPYAPTPYDPAGRARPIVFAAPMQASGGALYQILPVIVPGSLGPALVYALPVSPSEARIASVILTLPTAPKAPPRLRVTVPADSHCPAATVDIYAPDAPGFSLAALDPATTCPSRCADRMRSPRGRVLFVSRSRSGARYEHRWIDYDALAGQVSGGR